MLCVLRRHTFAVFALGIGFNRKGRKDVRKDRKDEIAFVNHFFNP